MVQRVLRPWNAAALPEIMTGAFQERKLDVPVSFHEGQAAGRQPGSAARARGSGTAETQPRPNVKVTGAARFYRAASEWTAGLDFSRTTPHLLLD